MGDTDNTWNGRGILHVDMDAFFAAVEQLDHPEWRGLPVIIGAPSERGVVSTASYEARLYGVRSAMPSVRAMRLCPNAIWAPPRFHRYRELSQAVFDILGDFTPHVQPVSVDEAFLDVSPTESRPEPPDRIAHEISARIDTLGLTCSIGVATGKTVAKIASDFDKPHGITVVRPGDEAVFLSPLPVETMSGIGARTAHSLHEVGLRTLGQLAALDDATAVEVLGSGGPTITARARGIDPRPVRANDPRKSVSAEHTFSSDLRDRAEVRDAVARLAERVGRRLRRAELAGRTVTVKVRYSDFSTRTARTTLDSAMDEDHAIASVAADLVEGLWSPGVGVRLLGVGVSGFGSHTRQLGFIDSEPDDLSDGRRRELTDSVDAVRERFGDTAVGFGARGIRPRDDETSDE